MKAVEQMRLELSVEDRNSLQSLCELELRRCTMTESKDKQELKIIKGTEHPEEFTKQDDPRLLTPQEIQDVVDKAWAKGSSPTATDWCEAQLAKADQHRLDRPELREKIAKQYHSAKIVLGEVYLHPVDWDMLTEEQKDWYREQADGILAFIPDEKEIREQEKERIISEVEKHRVAYTCECGTNFVISNKDFETLKQEKP